MTFEEQKIKEFEKAREDLLWKIEIFELGFSFGKNKKRKKKEVIKKLLGLKDIINDNNIINLRENKIFNKDISEMEWYEFSIELGDYIRLLVKYINKEFNTLIPPFNTLLQHYEKSIMDNLL